ncbi:tRNA-modifying protein YgfZ [Idiomarina tyrosinivorans]|uniref:tRNA-modifying protein YgfZ n=1 Tax=Idiomarina tyrosinivorans TaxID=1445662 RepID=A0A432ZRY0_9GAMM|nr:tRNA-modifying protein YgfZ [Idiomarina tyrosinivorans]RUO80586.1 tRNA-modifying protein YgfZ [Idiomarina tyrosinivorans]
MLTLTQEFTKACEECVTVSLTDYGIIALSGADAQSFLQGQLTCDLNQLEQQGWLYGALCDPTGKAFSVFWLTRWNERLLLIQQRESIEKALAQLQKYAIFNQVEIRDISADTKILGIFGESCNNKLSPLLKAEIDAAVVNQPEWVALRVGEAPQQWLVIGHSGIDAEYDQRYWQALEIERGRPQIAALTQLAFVPQMLNVQALNGISFTKGCYIGQETIARMKYLGKQKRAMFRLSGKATALPQPGATVEVALGEQRWRRAGTVISAVNRAEHHCDLLAVLPADATAEQTFRLRDDEASLLEIHSLPYQLET